MGKAVSTPSRRNVLRERIRKMETAERDLDSTTPANPEEQDRKDRLLGAIRERRRVVSKELAIREQYAKAKSKSRRAALKRAYESLKAEYPNLYEKGGVADPCLVCVGKAVENFKADQRASEHFTQEKNNSCVIASTRNMILMLTGKEVSEKKLRAQMRKIMKKPNHDFNKTPINPLHAVKLLEKHGVKATYKNNVPLNDLVTMTETGKPVLIGFKNPGHRVMLDSVGKDQYGNPIYYVRDPGSTHKGKVREMSQADLEKKYNQNAIVIIPE